ncbi:TNF receptor-associated factor homolog 1a-like [Impatiens glandulifera]|uniref:TNF receptor-associated factor homolog 1a-like n=1 Tax=Impatiens glandulifera TaxID=253017 RepID=UPI001FB0EDD9|nr:TNF receptor-associated factor homolog 1a-like [Impatiens glandulifera]XP_047317120.1 TNF receptor-associated factor homolog 1a-like [Impatiens glandulifera]
MGEGYGKGRYCDDASSSHQHCQHTDGMGEWRFSNLEEDSSDPPISSPYWDIDVNYDGPKPSSLYKKFTWQIDRFSQVMNKKEIRSKVFEMGGYEWYILIYPQGCEVNNHLSLFLCVANHEQLSPGWSHFAQFAVAVVNKDTNRAKFSDTMHRFWKKEHDWGWKKFIDLSKVLDGYVSKDTLIIKTQVQVIRERTDRPFPCLDPWFRRALLPAYLSNVEQTFLRYVDERQSILVKLRENKVKWSSFYDFWMDMNKYSKYLMMRVRSDIILKLIVKHFYVEKEISSTLVMDSLHSGLRYLEDHEKNKERGKVFIDGERALVPLVRAEKGVFVLVDDLVLLVERAAKEPLPPKVDRGHLNRAQDGVLAKELNQSDLYYEETRLTEIGRRIIELFSLIHVISKIEVAYQEAISLKRQEELIREEEEELVAEAKRGATERDKKSKKKQGKQKRNNRKGKDKGRVEKQPSLADEEFEERSIPDETKDNTEESEPGVEEISDASDSVDCAPEVHPPDYVYKDDGPINTETAISEVNPFEEATNDGTGSNQSYPVREAESPSVVDDSSFTYSTDPVESTLNEHSEGEFLVKQKRQRSFNRRWSKQGEVVSNEAGWTNNNVFSRSAEPVNYPMQPNYPSGRSRGQQEAVSHHLPGKTIRPYWRPVKVEEAAPEQNRRPSLDNNQIEVKRFSEQPTAAAVVPSLQSSSSGEIQSAHLPKPLIKGIDSSTIRNPSYSEVPRLDAISVPAKSKVDSLPIEKTPLQNVPIVSRPLTVSTEPAPSPSAPIALPVKTTTPLLSRSVSAVGRVVSVSSVPTSTTQSYLPRSYRNAILNGPVSESSVVGHQLSEPTLWSSINHQLSEPTLWSSNNIFDDVAVGSQSVPVPAEEFPHLDIINALFEDEHRIGMGMPSVNNNFQSLSNLHHYLNRQLNLSGPNGRSNESVPSCRFDQERGYHSGYDAGRYDSYGLFYNNQNYLHGYGDGQIAGLGSNQRQMIGGGSDMIPHMGMGRMELEGSHYRPSDYSNFACRVDGYGSTIFRPSDRR